MKTLCFAYPGDLETPTGGYGYDRKVIAGLRDLGWQVDLVSLGDGFPFPSQSTLAKARELFARVPDGGRLVVDGLALGVMDEAAAEQAERLDLIALVHHPLCRETGLSPDQAAELFQSERKSLAHARHVIVTSHATSDQVTDLFAIAQKDITVVLPGTDIPAPVSRAASGTTRLLSVGTVVPRKGYDLLLAALADLAELDWNLDVVGGLDADPDCYSALQAQVVDFGLSDRVTFHGALAPKRLPDFYRSADVFVLASRYEGYGMAYTEALAYALPVIGSGGGAVKDTLPPRASVYCGTEDIDSLRQALQLLILDEGRRRDMSAAARISAAQLPSWREAATQFALTLEAGDA